MANGTLYWFYVTAVYSSGESTPSNKVSVTPTSGGSTTVVTLTVNAAATSASIGVSGEVDWYKFQTTTAGTYTIQTYGSLDTYMYIYQGNQTSLISEDDDAGEGNNALISLSLSANTWYYATVKGFSNSVTGNYTIGGSGGGTTTLNPPRSLTATSGDTHCISR